MDVRPLAWPAPVRRPSSWALLRSRLVDVIPGLVVSLVSCGLFAYGCAGRDSLRPPDPEPHVAAVQPPPPPEPPPEVIKTAAPRAHLKLASEMRRALVPPPKPVVAPPPPPPPPAELEPEAQPTAVAALPAEPLPTAKALPPAAPAPIPAPAEPPVAVALRPEPEPAPAPPPPPPSAPEPAAPTPPLPQPPKPVVAEAPKPPEPPVQPPIEPALAAPAKTVTTPKEPEPPKKRVDCRKRPTPMSPQDATHHLSVAWEQVSGEPATIELISVLWGQWALETGRGRWMTDYNYAGLKGRAPGGGAANWWTWEETDKGARRVRARFRCYETASDGALDYMQLLWSRYPRALTAARRGDAVSFVLELDQGGFFTERPKHYVASVVSLSIEFRRVHRAARF